MRAGDCDRKGSDGGEPIDDDQLSSVTCEVCEQADEVGLSIRLGTVDEPVPVLVERDCVVGLSGDVYATEDVVPGGFERGVHIALVGVGTFGAGRHRAGRQIRASAAAHNAADPCGGESETVVMSCLKDDIG